MAWQTVSFDQAGGTGGQTNALYCNYSFGSGSLTVNYWATQQSTSSSYRVSNVPVPTRPGCTFIGYYISYINSYSSVTWTSITRSDGSFYNIVGLWASSGTFQSPATAKWRVDNPGASIYKNSGVGGTDIIYFNDGDSKWYLDSSFTNEYTLTSHIELPTRECYRFLGCYSTNSTSGTKYINEDGTPTAAFLALSSPDDIITIYAQWELVSYKVTINHSSGSPTSTIIYAKVGATGADRFYSDSVCTNLIHAITPPSRELYRWNGAFSTSSQTSANTYINSSGEFQALLYDLSITANKTISYANYWTQVSYAITQYASSGWTYAQAKYYTDKTNGNIFADWLCETTALTHLPIPVKAGYRYIGSYSTNATTGTLYVNGSGVIQSALNTRKAATTIYPQGRAASSTLTLDANGGTGGCTIYYDATSGDTAFFDGTSAVITSVQVPTYTGNSFLGYFTDQTSGTQVTDSSGNILGSWTPTTSTTVYAHWTIDVSIIDVDAGEGATAGTSRFWYRGSSRKFYADSELTQEITSITSPSKRLFNLNGIYTEGNVLAVNSSGVIQSGFLPSGEFVNLHAEYTRRCYEVVLNASGGSSSVPSIYRAPSGLVWYTTDSLTTQISNVGVPTKVGHTFGGYSYGGTTVISSTGAILSAARINEDYVANAVWTANTYTLTFNGNGARPSFNSKTVTFGSAVGALPTLSNIPAKKSFSAWKIGTDEITSSTIWNYTSAQTAVATWESFFGNVTDYFNLGSANLIPESSDSGDNKQHVCAYNATSELPTTETSKAWRNPRVTYRVVGDMTLSVTLGRAFSGGSNNTGYMIAAVEVATAIGEPPMVTVSAVANEGVNAVKTYSVSIPVSARHRPQNLLGAIHSTTNGGDLQQLTLTAVCDPVVVAENNVPCASDVCHGRIEVSAVTHAYYNESEPSAGTNFTQVGAPVSNSGVGYKTWSVRVRKDVL